MPLWMIRAGRFGEFEDRFVSESRVYLTWDDLTVGCDIGSRPKIIEFLRQTWPDAKEGKIRNHAGQIWAFINEMKRDDVVVVPSKKKPELRFGVITSDCRFDPAGEPNYRHWRDVKWLREVPRTALDKDLLFSLGAIMTICQIQRNDAENRIRQLLRAPASAPKPSVSVEGEQPEAHAPVNYEELTRDEIATRIIRQFKGDDLERLVEAILRAQGYATFRSPKGADKGVDILAGSGPMGFDSPRICVQVKSEQSPIDHPTLVQLRGTMKDVGADQGLLVSWSGFKNTVERETARNFFSIRLWNQHDLLEQLFEHYDRLDEEIRAEIPLKRIWTLVPDDDSE
jgi:restriction system protein